jgi:hypothetical protein
VRRLASILLIVVAAGCGSDKSNAPKKLEGTYTIRTINNETLPIIFYDDVANSQRGEILSGSMTLNAGGTFSAPWSFRITDHGVVTTPQETCTGTFTRTGNHIVMEEVDNGSFCGGEYDGDWDGSDTFTEGNVVYRR